MSSFAVPALLPPDLSSCLESRNLGGWEGFPLISLSERAVKQVSFLWQLCSFWQPGTLPGIFSPILSIPLLSTQLTACSCHAALWKHAPNYASSTPSTLQVHCITVLLLKTCFFFFFFSSNSVQKTSVRVICSCHLISEYKLNVSSGSHSKGCLFWFLCSERKASTYH